MYKKRIIYGTLIVLVLSFIFHSVYDIFPNFFTSIFFPVNESIWEHNKIIVLSFLVLAIFEKLILKSGKSTFFINLISSIICILLLDLTFTPIYLYILNAQENFPLVIILYTLSIIVSIILSNKFMLENNKKVEISSGLAFILIFIIFASLTYYPPKFALFYDFSASLYGIE